MKLYIANREFIGKDGQNVKYQQLYVGVEYNGSEMLVPVKPVSKYDKGKLNLFAEKLESEEE